LGLVFETDPGDPLANALAAWCRQQRHLMNWPGGEDDDREAAKRLARVAIAEGGDVPLALAVAGAVRAALTRDHDSALAAVDRATMINPNAAIVLAFEALTRCVCGVYDKANEEAVTYARKAIDGNRNFAFPYCVLALGCARLGQREEAVQAVRQLVSAAPNFRIGTLRKIRFSDAARLQSDFALLREARLPE